MPIAAATSGRSLSATTASPGSGTAAMLEAVHGVGDLLKSGWKPKRTLIFASWDGEEEG